MQTILIYILFILVVLLAALVSVVIGYIAISIISSIIQILIKPRDKKVEREKALKSALSRILHYSFDEIGWEYEKLNSLEKKALSKSEFEAIKKEYR